MGFFSDEDYAVRNAAIEANEQIEREHQENLAAARSKAKRKARYWLLIAQAKLVDELFADLKTNFLGGNTISGQVSISRDAIFNPEWHYGNLSVGPHPIIDRVFGQARNVAEITSNMNQMCRELQKFVDNADPLYQVDGYLVRSMPEESRSWYVSHLVFTLSPKVKS